MSSQQEQALPLHGEVEADEGEAGDEVERQPVPAEHRRAAVLGDHLTPQAGDGGEVTA